MLGRALNFLADDRPSQLIFRLEPCSGSGIDLAAGRLGDNKGWIG